MKIEIHIDDRLLSPFRWLLMKPGGRVAIGLCTLLVAAVASADPTTVPHRFKSGDVARAADVNANFDQLAAAIDGKVPDFTTLEVQLDVKWVDDKQVNRKVVFIPAEPNVTEFRSIAIPHGINKPQDVIRIQGTLNTVDKGHVPVPFPGIGTTANVQVTMDETNVYVVLEDQTQFGAIIGGSIILHYTK